MSRRVLNHVAHQVTVMLLEFVLVFWVLVGAFVCTHVLTARRMDMTSKRLVDSGKLPQEWLPFARTHFDQLPSIPALVLRSFTVGPFALLSSTSTIALLSLCSLFVSPATLGTTTQRAAKLVCLCVGIRIRETGIRASTSAAPCVVANHNSAFDIIVLLTKGCSFVSSDGVRLLPLVGQVAKAIGCIFVARECRDSRQDAKKKIADRLAAQMTGKSRVKSQLVVFPEGSTNNGSYLLQFRRGAFEANVPLQPLRIEYADYHINYTLISLVELCCLTCTLPGREVTLHWLPVITPTPGQSSDDLARKARTAIANVVSAHGHPAMIQVDMAVSHREALLSANFIRQAITTSKINKSV